MFAKLHSKVSVDDLLHGMIIQSANDACIVFAEALAGNEGEFGHKLTQRAREIGLEKSTFTNSNGSARPGREGHHARARHARAPHHRDLSRFL